MAVINLTGNLITSICLNAFSSLFPNTVHSLNWQVCCMSGSWLRCNIKQIIFTSCNDLLYNRSASYLCLFIGILALMLNSIFIVIHIKLFFQLQGNKFFTLSLSVTDCLYGMYLLTINCADWYYRGYYAGAELKWKVLYVRCLLLLLYFHS